MNPKRLNVELIRALVLLNLYLVILSFSHQFPLQTILEVGGIKCLIDRFLKAILTLGFKEGVAYVVNTQSKSMASLYLVSLFACTYIYLH